MLVGDHEVLWLTLGISVLNLGLGFLVGVYLGYGPAGAGFFGHGTASSLVIPAPPESMEGAIQQAAARQAERKAAQSPLPPAEPTTPSAAPLPPTAEGKLDSRPVENSVLEFNLSMADSETLATALDTRLRGCHGQYDETTVRECIAALKTGCQEHLQTHKQLLERFQARASEMADFQALAKEIETGNAELVSQMQTTLCSLEKLDSQADLRSAGERLLEEIDQLRGTRHMLRDEHETAYLSLARQHGRSFEIDAQLQRDPLTGLANRIGLETRLAQWWADGRAQSQPVSVATVDLDHFASVNAEQGVAVGDHILIQIGQWIAEMAGGESIVARVGQRFFTAMAGIDLATLGPKVELLRQSLSQTMFTHDGQILTITATAALATVAPDDTPTSILERLGLTLATARETGRNRSFADGEQGAKMVESSDLGVQPRSVAV